LPAHGAQHQRTRRKLGNPGRKSSRPIQLVFSQRLGPPFRRHGETMRERGLRTQPDGQSPAMQRFVVLPDSSIHCGRLSARGWLAEPPHQLEHRLL
jgi:hypothetical protein